MSRIRSLDFSPEIFSRIQITYGSPEHSRLVESMRECLPHIFSLVWPGRKYRETYDYLHALYSQYPRQYHNVNHLARLFAELTLRSKALHEENSHYMKVTDPVIALSIFFHDAVYVPGSSINELESNDLFDHLSQGVIFSPIKDIVTSNILATQDHTPIIKSREDSYWYFAQKLFLDLDLHFLGIPWEEFKKNRAEVAAEYPGVPEEAIRAGVVKFFSGFLKRKQIFYTKTFKMLYEEQARSNMERLIKECS